MKNVNILIVAGGSINYSLLIETVKSDDYYIIGADRGLKYLYECGIHPDMAIGDFDSLDSGLAEVFKSDKNTIILNPEKDFTDTHAALMEALKLKPRRVVILGASGSRMDHTIANISILKICCDNGVDAEIRDVTNRIRIIKDRYSISREEAYGDYVSFIPLGDVAEAVTLEGFKYNITEKALYQGDSIGVSNEISAKEAHISIGKGYLIMMETRDFDEKHL